MTAAPERPLPRAFFERPTEIVARELLGKLLVRTGPVPRTARIVEVEAYLAERDQASHARRGPTPRAAIMFGPAGHLYVYLVYGMHHCMNVVTESAGTAGAVLLRAAEPLGGHELSAPGDRLPLTGPGKLCRGLSITREHNGLDLSEGEGLYLAEGQDPPPRIKRSARIGVAYAGTWANRQLRFYVPGNAYVSGRPRD